MSDRDIKPVLSHIGMLALQEHAKRSQCTLDRAMDILLFATLPDHPLGWCLGGLQGRAHGRVNSAVRRGKIPPAHKLPCVDCGHVWRDGEPNRHEYDHYLGYAPEHALHVQAVCKSCHERRTVACYAKYGLPNPRSGR